MGQMLFKWRGNGYGTGIQPVQPACPGGIPGQETGLQLFAIAISFFVIFYCRAL
jgi:hypothetical protein